MIELIPLVVTGGVVKKFSDNMIGGERRVRRSAKRNVNRVNRNVRRAKGRVSANRGTTYPRTKYPPF